MTARSSAAPAGGPVAFARDPVRQEIEDSVAPEIPPAALHFLDELSYDLWVERCGASEDRHAAGKCKFANPAEATDWALRTAYRRGVTDGRLE